VQQIRLLLEKEQDLKVCHQSLCSAPPLTLVALQERLERKKRKHARAEAANIVID
jgi:hypothetical protein